MPLNWMLLLLSINYFIAWQNSKTEADPDWAMFNLAAFTGSWYGRDFSDCKTPIIHLWYFALAKCFGTSVRQVKWANHFILGCVGIFIAYFTGNFYAGLAFSFLVNSPILWAFHGNVSQLVAAFMALAICTSFNPWISCTFAILAVLTEPKILPAFIVMVVYYVWIWPALAWLGIGIICAGLLYLFKRHIFNWIIEGSVIIPWRMASTRKGLYAWMPWWTPYPLFFVMIYCFLGGMAKPDLLYWLPAIMYVLVCASGKVIRGNHLIPLAAWIVNAGIKPEFLLGLVIIEFIADGFLIGDIWARHYSGFGEQIKSVKKAGEFMLGKPGMLWVNGMHTEAYIYARKPVPFGMAEQIEIRETNSERRKVMKEAWKMNPPDWVLETPTPDVKFEPNGYEMVAQGFCTKIYRRSY